MLRVTAGSVSSKTRARASESRSTPRVVDPDEYTVFKPSLEDPELDPLVDVRVGAKRRKAVYAEHGLTRTVDTTPEERSQRVLTDTEVRLLADWALTV
ncbi:phosphoenolpyruvate synthase/pyruvate phosphate dikinase [Streptomyces sp. TE12347]